MRHRILLSIALAAATLAAQPAQKQGLPPLIDRELLFGDPEIGGAQISPDGKFIAFLKPWKSTRNVWVKKTSESFDSARLLTTEAKRPVAGFLWTRDGKYVVYAKDNDGDENFNVYGVDPSAPAPAGSDAPPSRDLTGVKGAQVQLYSAPRDEPDVIYVGINDRDKAWHDLYKLKVSTGERTLLRKNTERIAGWFFDRAGRLRLATRAADSGEQEILRADSDQFQKIYSCGIFDVCSPLAFHKDGKRVYLETNLGETTNLAELRLMDLATGKTEFVESDPLKRVDLGGAVFSEETEQLLATSYVDDRVRRVFHDKKFEADFHWIEKQHPNREVNFGSRTRDEQLWLVNLNGDTEPGEVYLFDRKARTLSRQYQSREKLPRTSLSETTTIRYKSSDGLEIPAYLTLPKGLPAKGLPLLVVPHGGPWGRDVWGFNGLAQFFANRGYAVLMPNFRGSTGYGKNFLNAGNGEWGRKMQDDITWGVKHLIGEGVADPKRIGILGGSYGGYATLAGVAFTPDLYRAAVDIVGPSNLITLLDAIPPYWESFRKTMFARMADPATPEGKKWLEERSPLNSADKIKTPLMVVQGANDPRVNRREAEQIVIALRDRGFPVEYMLARDEGHGFQRPVNNMAMFMAVEKFLATYLDGRYQQDGTPEVTARLKEITVDPKTVVVTKKVDAAAAGVPKPAVPMKPGVYKYSAKIQMGTREIAMKLSTTIEEAANAWNVTDVMQTPAGPATDRTTLDKESLTLRERNVEQGPMKVHLVFAGNKITGTMGMGGSEKPVATDLGGSLFADAAGAFQAIACLPLADGYSAIYRNFDLQKQKEKLMQLQVKGMEAVGSTQAFKLELTSAEGGPEKTTLWIAQDSRKVLRVVSSLPQLGGATLTAELVE